MHALSQGPYGAFNQYVLDIATYESLCADSVWGLN
jgi:hypothetical protein